jgi:hypothetical protein
MGADDSFSSPDTDAPRTADIISMTDAYTGLDFSFGLSYTTLKGPITRKPGSHRSLHS